MFGDREVLDERFRRGIWLIIMRILVILFYFIFVYVAFDCIMGIWQIGRIPNEWARCLLPLVRDKKIRVEGFFKYAPEVLSIMDTVHLSVRYSCCEYLLLNKITLCCII